MFLIPALGRWEQGRWIAVQDHGYVVNLRLVWATYDPDSKKIR